jgi:MoxR-like ATPase
MQIAARLNRNYVRVPFADDMDKYSLIGQRYPTPDGNGKWHDGILAAAIRIPGTVIALDEPTLAKPGTLAVIQTLIDTRRLSIEETGEVVAVADGVTFIALDNTSGFGDETGRYSGTGVMNEAFLNRFPRKIEIERLDSAMVVKIISSRTNLHSPAACDELAKLLRLSEDCARNGKTSTHLSLRDILCFASDLAQGLPAQACLDATLLAALPPTEREAFRQNVLAHGMPLDQLAMLALTSIARI